MDKMKTFFRAIKEILTAYGMVMIILGFFAMTIGEMGKGYTSVLSLGNKGISIDTMVQFLGIIVIGTVNQSLFFTDYLIKHMALWLRTLCMILVNIVFVIIFVIRFSWFPIDRWEAWTLFFILFIICFTVTTGISIRNEKEENKKMAEALKRIKEAQDDRSH